MCRENELPVLQEWFCRCLLHHGLSIKGGEKEHTGPILSVDCTRSVLSTTSPGTAVPAVLEEPSACSAMSFEGASVSLYQQALQTFGVDMTD